MFGFPNRKRDESIRVTVTTGPCSASVKVMEETAFDRWREKRAKKTLPNWGRKLEGQERLNGEREIVNVKQYMNQTKRVWRILYFINRLFFDYSRL